MTTVHPMEYPDTGLQPALGCVPVTDEMVEVFVDAIWTGSRHGEDLTDGELRTGLAAVAVLVAAQALAGHRTNGCEECAACVREDRAEERAAVLAELTAAGRLLPEGGETRQEWSVRRDSKDVMDPGTEAEARAFLQATRAYWDRRVCDLYDLVTRTVTAWLDGTQLVGPWQPVDTDERT